MVVGKRVARRRAGVVPALATATAVATASLGGLDATPAVAGAAPTSALVALDPVRLADTRQLECGCDRLGDDTVRVAVLDAIDAQLGVAAPGHTDVVAVVATLTAPPADRDGFVTASPGGAARPLVSSLNTRTDRVVANSAIVPLADDGTIDVYRFGGGDVVVDLHAIFVRAQQSRDGRFVALPPTRLVDTRTPTPPTGALPARGELRVALPDGVPDDATAVVVNVTSVGAVAPGHLSIRPAGSDATDTSVLNVDGTGAGVAASVIAPVDAGGLIIESFSGGHVVVDATGWFTGPSAPASSDGLFVPTPQRRLLDTRDGAERLNADGTIEMAVPDAGSAIAANITVVDADAAGFVTAYPAGTSPPPTSSVNPAFWNHTVANMAIVGQSRRGLAVTSMRGTDLIVDTSGFFSGTPAVAPAAPRPNRYRAPRALVVGDSTLGGVDVFPESLGAFRGIDLVVDAKSCRRLQRPSCRSGVTGVTPNTAVEAILTTPGSLDVVVVKAGYNDWFSDFPTEADAVIRAARAKGAHTVVWLTYNLEWRREQARAAMRENNRTLRDMLAGPGYDDVLLADWLAYSGERRDWFWDGTHLNRAGSFAVADYVSRWVAAIEHRPCPAPWFPGGPITDPCVPPEWIGPVPTPELL